MSKATELEYRVALLENSVKDLYEELNSLAQFFNGLLHISNPIDVFKEREEAEFPRDVDIELGGNDNEDNN